MFAANMVATLCSSFMCTVCAIGVFYSFLIVVQVIRRRARTTALRGPPRSSFIWGVAKDLFSSPDVGAQIEDWAKEYGTVYEVPWAFGGREITLCDPKAIAHLFGREPYTYTITSTGKIGTEIFVGNGILTAIGDCHRRQRKTLAPALNNNAIRHMTPVFYDSAYKVKSIWDGLIGSSDDCIVDVQNWMNLVSFDSIGIAGFSHDFGALDGKPSPVKEVMDDLGNYGLKGINKLFFVVAEAFPWIFLLPITRTNLIRKLNDTMGKISDVLLTKSRKERKEGTSDDKENKSVLSLLISSEDQTRRLHLTQEEVMAQAKALLLAGYEATSISLTWVLIELSKNQDVQNKLRAELLEFGVDPSYDQLSSQLPYLDAVVHETLRLRPPLPDFTRMAVEDDVIPLSKPVRTRNGTMVDHISVAKGTYLTVSVLSINCSTSLWGPDAKEFKPERWIGEKGIPAGAKEVQGHRHLLTFIDGPRTCLGKGFAIAELKTVLSVLVKHFIFELRDGPETEIETVVNILTRPKVSGEKGTAVPLRIRRFE